MMVTPTPAANPQHFDAVALAAEIEKRFGPAVSPSSEDGGTDASFIVRHPSALTSLCQFLFAEAGCSFGGLIVEERDGVGPPLRFPESALRLGSLHSASARWIPGPCPASACRVNAADWYEREAEDLFGLEFEEHPRLGDFVLHDQVWQEGLMPMRKAFDAGQMHFEKRPQEDWRPMLVVQDPGAFAMPVGPVYEGGIGESVHFLLETVGEDVIRAVPRLFYNYRAVEKIAEGKSVLDVLLLAERFSAKSAFAHSLGYCQAVEKAVHLEIPHARQPPARGAVRTRTAPPPCGRDRGDLPLHSTRGFRGALRDRRGATAARLRPLYRTPLPVRTQYAWRTAARLRQGSFQRTVARR